MDAEKRIKMHIGELTVTIHALQAKVEELEAKVKELTEGLNNGGGISVQRVPE